MHSPKASLDVSKSLYSMEENVLSASQKVELILNIYKNKIFLFDKQ